MSSHLPEYLVAAFVKRISRIALTAPANALLMVLPFIGKYKDYVTYFIHGQGFILSTFIREVMQFYVI